MIKFRQGLGEVGRKSFHQPSLSSLGLIPAVEEFFLVLPNTPPAPNGTNNSDTKDCIAVIIMSASTHDHQWSRHEFPGRARDATRHWPTPFLPTP